MKSRRVQILLLFLPLLLVSFLQPPSTSIIPSLHSDASRVAVCLTGHLRTFSHPSIRTSLHRNLISPLKSTNYTPEIFFILTAPHTGPNPSLTPLSNFSPVHISFLPSIPLALHPPSSCPNVRRLSPTAHAPLLRLQQCLHYIRLREIHTGTRYSWIYKTRPDVLLASKLPSPYRLKANAVYLNRHNPGASAHARDQLKRIFPRKSALVRGVIGDHVMVGHRDIMERVLDAVRAYDDCRLWRMKGTINVEVALMFWMVHEGVKWEDADWKWVLVRQGPLGECWRLKWVEQKSNYWQKKCWWFNRTGQWDFEEVDREDL